MNLEISTPQLILILLWLALGKLIVVGMLTAIQNSSFVEKLLNTEKIQISPEQTMRELKYPILSLLGDAVMFKDLLFKKIKF